ncbi:hypothetical protein ABZ636_38815 [Streptomyces sp. NPDC007251]|uniref:hypothetical protein n=1 Tax=unclassified Streptomyces TaxID=2593676 RepID=UPI0033D0157F
MRDLAGYPPRSVRARSLQMAGDLHEDTDQLLVSAGQRTSELVDRMEHPFRLRGELVEDWHAAENLAADVPPYERRPTGCSTRSPCGTPARDNC